MAYDPKKKRPTRDSLDAVVDEIFGEDAPKAKPTKKTPPKSAPAKAPKAKSSESKTPSSKAKPAEPESRATFEKEATLDNVLPLYPESNETPLIMQPQVWVATGIAALIVLFIARGRRKR